jgi:DNA sulfur modification protein DndC
MTAMIQNDQEKEWMMPLLDLRNALDFRNGKDGDEEMTDRHLRDFRRMNGTLTLFKERLVHGPYTQSAREDWLRKLLTAQQLIRRSGPDSVRHIDLISLAELQEIRRIWVIEKHEMEDNLPKIYSQVMGDQFPGPRLDDNMVMGPEEMNLLGEICGSDRLHFEMARELLSVERQQRMQARRAGLFDRLEKAISRHYYDNSEDAVEVARRHAQVWEAAAVGLSDPSANEMEPDAPPDALN